MRLKAELTKEWNLELAKNLVGVWKEGLRH